MAGMRTTHVVLAVLWLPASLIMVAGPVWMVVDRWRTFLDSHPITIAVAVAVVLVGVVGAIWSIAVLIVEPATPVRATVGRRIAVIGSVLALVLGLAMSGLLAWSRPFPADQKAIDALGNDADVTVVERLSWYELAPTETLVSRTTPSPTPPPPLAPSATPTPRIVPLPRRVGLVFSPGARVDARAYAALLRPIAATGVLVVVLKEPFGIALMPDGQAARVVQVHPEITVWVAAGHSLGAVRAAQTVQDQPAFSALVLWAGYPASPITRTGVRVLSVSGGQDGLATPDKIVAARSLLPTDTVYEQVPGANHGCFGDYGVQPGDGTVTGSRDEAQARIVAVTDGFVSRLP